MCWACIRFAAKSANVILIGNGDYKDIFSGCEYALLEMEICLDASTEDRGVMERQYGQKNGAEPGNIGYERPEKEKLCYYWNLFHKQLKWQYFDYNAFKSVYRDTVEYFIPRVTADHVYRSDLPLIREIGALRIPKNTEMDGSMPWERDAACQFTDCFFSALTNAYAENTDFSAGRFLFWVRVDEMESNSEVSSVYESGYTTTAVEISTGNLSEKIDILAQANRLSAYQGDKDAADRLWHRLRV